MKRLLLVSLLRFLIALLYGSYAVADPLPGPIPIHVIRVIDGDTVVGTAEIWLNQNVEVAVRLRGVDTPELRAACPQEKELAKAARRQLSAWVEQAGALYLKDIEADKYGGRVLANLSTANGDTPIPHLLTTGLARAYDGGRRNGWCT